MIAFDLGNPADHESVQSGPFDWFLLCQGCEGHTGPLDGYLCSVLRDGEGVSFRKDQRSERIHWIEGVDHARFRQAILFMLWRCLATTRHEYAACKDEASAERLRLLLRSGDEIQHDQFPILLCKRVGRVGLVGSDGVEVAVGPSDLPATPCVYDFGGRRAAIMSYYDFEIRVAIDEAPLASPWAGGVVPNMGPVPVVVGHLADRSDMRTLLTEPR